MSEQLLIVILYHLEGVKNFKYYYKYAVEIQYKSLFKEASCYNRFIQIMPKLEPKELFGPLLLFIVKVVVLECPY